MSRVDRAEALLASLGQPTPRPKPEPRGLVERLCRYGCGRQLVIASLSTGQWCALERHPSGDMIVDNGIAITCGPTHVGLTRYVWHRCVPREIGR